MYRCHALCRTRRAVLWLGLHATLLGLMPLAQAQVQRNFPATALRGELVITAPPEVLLNGKPSRLSPGARIRGEDNMLQMSAALIGRPLKVNYTVDLGGQVHEVWILRAQEVRMRPWPRTAAEASAWQFDPVQQSWSKP